MCNDPAVHGGQHHPSRRTVLGGLAAAGGAVLAGAPWPGGAPPASAAGSYSMAMHIHGPFSEQYGSMDGHLQQATATGVDVLWWTDHDFRMSEYRYRKVVHFDSLSSENVDGTAWTWKPASTGSLASCSGGIVSTPRSPNDTEGSGALAVSATATAGSTGSYGYVADSQAAGWNYQANVYGQTLTLDVFVPAGTASDAYLELLVGSSWHCATAGRPAGYYAISYRFGGPDPVGTRRTEGTTGIVPVGVVPGTWSTVSVTPSTDVAALWPSMQRDDFATYSLTLRAVSGGSPASGWFDYLRFTRQYASGDLPLQRQQALMSAYAAPYPKVTQLQGLELSLLTIHVNWFGPNVHLPDYTGVTSATYNAFLASQVQAIHAASGVASYNHPFGASEPALQSTAVQDADVLSVASSMLSNQALGCDVMEVGYPSRGGKDLMHHTRLWDLLSANCLFLTGNGVSDDHYGLHWTTRPNNWFTSVWAPSRSMGDLVAALAAGRAWCGSLSAFRGSLDLTVDGVAPMGSVSVATVASRSVRVTATGLPAGSTLEVVRGAVDYAGTKSARSVVVTSLSAASLAGGSATVSVDTRTGCYVRSQVRNSAGTVIALSNPVWLLRSAPPNGIPAARAA